MNENLGLTVNYVKYDFTDYDEDFSTLWGDLVVNFKENVAFKGQYFTQDTNWGEDASAWKAILTFSQDMLKFTDLWVEYAQIDEYFYFGNADPYAWTLGETSPYLHDDWFAKYTDNDVNILLLVAKQKWNDQWWTYVRYMDVNADSDWHSYKAYTASVRYNYTPNLWFEVGYDALDLDHNWRSSQYEGDNMVWFRTTVNF
jgi:hypothetical protein